MSDLGLKVEPGSRVSEPSEEPYQSVSSLSSRPKLGWTEIAVASAALGGVADPSNGNQMEPEEPRPQDPVDLDPGHRCK
jgi:hypothetical protein